MVHFETWTMFNYYIKLFYIKTLSMCSITLSFPWYGLLKFSNIVQHYNDQLGKGNNICVNAVSYTHNKEKSHFCPVKFHRLSCNGSMTRRMLNLFNYIKYLFYILLSLWADLAYYHSVIFPLILLYKLYNVSVWIRGLGMQIVRRSNLCFFYFFFFTQISASPLA